ncbi:MAG: hypothetical protein M3012_06295 [Staphylococcus epidermidis]|nr:hypothetical protein [Staphylococcus epidermidis]
MQDHSFQFINSTEYVFSMISDNAKKRKIKLKLTREKISDDIPMVSALINNTRSSKRPNLINNEKGIEISKNLQFKSIDEMLWGNINMDTLLEIAMLEFAKSEPFSSDDNFLNSPFTKILMTYVPFSCELANANFNKYNLKDDIFKRAIQWVLYEYQIFNRKYDLDSEKTETINERFDNKFKERFFINAPNMKTTNEEEMFNYIISATDNKKGINKFSKRFPLFLQDFLSDEFSHINIDAHNFGIISYQILTRSLNYQDDAIMNNRENTKNLDTYLNKLKKHTASALEELEKIQKITVNKKANH